MFKVNPIKGRYLNIGIFGSYHCLWQPKNHSKNGHRMLDLLGESPYDFVMSHDNRQLKKLEGFLHRTFNGNDLIYFIKSLQHIY